jgi:hypothetical protein
MRVPAPPRLAQLAHFFQVNPAAVFGNKSTLVASIRRHHHHQDPFGTSAPLPSPTASTSSTSASTNSESSSSSDSDPTFDAETVPDDRTLVEEESRRRSSSSHSDAEADEASSLTLLSDIPEEASYLNFKHRRTVPSSRGRGRRPASSSERPDPSARLSIIYPLPSAESLLAATYGPTPSATVIDASIAPPLCTPSPLSPPPAHYKRRRARIMSDEDHDSDPNQAPIRYVSCHLASLR